MVMQKLFHLQKKDNDRKTAKPRNSIYHDYYLSLN